MMLLVFLLSLWFLFHKINVYCVILMGFQIRITSILGNYGRLMADKVDHLKMLLNYDIELWLLPFQVT